MCSRHLPKYFPDNVQSTHIGKTSIFSPSLHLLIAMTGAALTGQYSTSQSIQLRHSLDHQLALLDGTQFVSCCIQQSHRLALSSHSSQITVFHSLAPHQSLICSQKDGLSVPSQQTLSHIFWLILVLACNSKPNIFQITSDSSHRQTRQISPLDHPPISPQIAYRPTMPLFYE